jgi:acyl dehydratase
LARRSANRWTLASGEAQITAPDIKRFAAEFDPQPMHLDEATAAETIF